MRLGVRGRRLTSVADYHSTQSRESHKKTNLLLKKIPNRPAPAHDSVCEAPRKARLSRVDLEQMAARMSEPFGPPSMRRSSLTRRSPLGDFCWADASEMELKPVDSRLRLVGIPPTVAAGSSEVAETCGRAILNLSMSGRSTMVPKIRRCCSRPATIPPPQR